MDTVALKKDIACQRTAARTVAPLQHLRLQHQALNRPPMLPVTMVDVVRSSEVLSVMKKAPMEDVVQNTGKLNSRLS